MGDLYAVITGISIHAYETAAFIALLSIPARMLYNALNGKLRF